MGNNHIVTMIHPFVMQQEVSVYMSGECKRVVTCTLDEIEKTIAELAEEFDIDRVDIGGGNQLYNLKIKERLMSKYVENKLDITVH